MGRLQCLIAFRPPAVDVQSDAQQGLEVGPVRLAHHLQSPLQSTDGIRRPAAK